MAQLNSNCTVVEIPFTDPPVAEENSDCCRTTAAILWGFIFIVGVIRFANSGGKCYSCY